MSRAASPSTAPAGAGRPQPRACRPPTPRPAAAPGAGTLAPADRAALAEVVNALGRLSAAAQGLRGPITDFFRLAEGGGGTLYLAAQRPTVRS